MNKSSSVPNLPNPIHLQLVLALVPESSSNPTSSMVAFYWVNLAKLELYFPEFPSLCSGGLQLDRRKTCTKFQLPKQSGSH